MGKLIAYHGDPEIKEKYVNRVKLHKKLDEIKQGVGYEKVNGKVRACGVGCTLDKYDHKSFETELGIPEWLARLEDRIFEGLPAKNAPQFAVDFLISIHPGVNLEPVKWRFCAFILKENIERVLLLKIDDKLKEQVIDSIRVVLKLHEDSIKTGKHAAWSAARSAAWFAAWSAAWSAESAAWFAAWSAAWSAESAAWSAARSARSAARSAESAARSAARSAAWSAAWSAESAAWSAESAARSARSAAWSAEPAEYTKFAKELLRLLKAQK